MSGNPLLKLGIPLVVLGFLAVMFLSSRGEPPTTDAGKETLRLTDEEARDLGIEGDTSADTLRTLIAEMKNTRRQVEELSAQNQRLLAENQRLLQRDQAIEQRISGALQRATQEAENKLESATQQVSSQAQNLLGELQDKISGLSDLSRLGGAGSSGQHDDLPVGLGLGSGEGSSRFTQQVPPPSALIWIEPLDAVPTDPRNPQSGLTFPNAFKAVDKVTTQGVERLSGQHTASASRTEGSRAVYTIAENSTLTGSITMTALLGRIPIDGTVNDPYPFKVLIGKDNLAANGLELPEVKGAVMSGTATGDWTLSCVRGKIESITFVFEDGSIRTLPEPAATVTRSGERNTDSDSARIRGGIGYLSDPYGIPCLVGERKSNAKEYLGNQSLLTAAGAAIASAYSKDDNGRSASGLGNGTVISDRNQAFNNILSQGVGDIREWMNKLYGQAFAAIYVPPQQQVAVHIEQELSIDYEPNGRKVLYESADTHTAFSRAAVQSTTLD